MADQSPAPAYTPNGAVMPSTSVFSSESTSGTSKSKMTQEDLAEFHAWKAAKDEQLAAMKSPAPEAGLPNEGDVQADIASREQSAMAPTAAPNYAAMAPDSPEYQAAISGAMSGNQAPMPPATPAAPDVVVPKSFPEDATGNPQNAYPLAPNDISARAAPRATSQQFNDAPAIQGQNGIVTPSMQAPKTLEAQQDESARDEGAYKAKVLDATRQQMADIERQKQERLMTVQANYERMSQQFLRSGQVKPMEPNLLQRFGVALGAFGAGLTGSQNFAQQMLSHQMDLDMEAQKANLQTAMERLKMAGARPAQIMEYAQQQTLHAMAMQKAQLEAFDAQSQKLLAPFPQFQQKAAVTIAAEKAKQAEIFANFAAKTTSDSATTGYSSPHTTTVTADKVNSRAIPGAKDTEDYALDIEQGKDAEKLERHVNNGDMPTPEEFAELENRANVIIARNAKESGSPAESLWGRIARGVDAYPTSIFPDGMSEDKREAFKLASQLGHVLTAKKFGIGILSNDKGREETFSQILPNRQDSAEGANRKAMQLVELFKSTAQKAAEVSKAGQQEQRLEARKAGAPTSTPAPKPSKGWEASDVEAYKWAASHPGPKASEVSDSLKAKYGSKQ